MRLHHFVGDDGDRCLHQVFREDRIVTCGESADHPIHNVDVDVEKIALRRMLGQRRDYRDIELGNPTLRDRGV